MDLQTTAPVAPGEAGEREIERFIERQAQRTGADEANAEEQRLKAEDRRRFEEMRQEHRAAWIHHYRKLAFASLQNSRDYRKRARRLEQGETA